MDANAPELVGPMGCAALGAAAGADSHVCSGCASCVSAWRGCACTGGDEDGNRDATRNATHFCGQTPSTASWYLPTIVCVARNDNWHHARTGATGTLCKARSTHMTQYAHGEHFRCVELSQ